MNSFVMTVWEGSATSAFGGVCAMVTALPSASASPQLQVEAPALVHLDTAGRQAAVLDKVLQPRATLLGAHREHTTCEGGVPPTLLRQRSMQRKLEVCAEEERDELAVDDVQRRQDLVAQAMAAVSLQDETGHPRARNVFQHFHFGLLPSLVLLGGAGWAGELCRKEDAVNRLRELRVFVQLVQDVHQHLVVELRLVDRAAACDRLRAWQLLRRLGQGAAVASVMHKTCEHHREHLRTSLQPRRRNRRMLRSQSNQHGCGVTPAKLLMMAALEIIIAELKITSYTHTWPLT